MSEVSQIHQDQHSAGLGHESPFTQVSLSIEGMTCASCSGTIERMLQSTEGVLNAQVDLTSNTATVDLDSSYSSKEVVDSIEEIGFGAYVMSEKKVQLETQPSPISFTQVSLSIEGMTCTSCSGTIERMLQSTEGVLNAQVDLTSNTATVDLDSSYSSKEVVDSIEEIGFGAYVMSEKKVQLETQPSPISSFSSSPITSFAPVSKKLELSFPNSQVDELDEISIFLRGMDGINEVESASGHSMKNNLIININQKVISIRSIISKIKTQFDLEVEPSVTCDGFQRGERLLFKQNQETSAHRSAFFVAFMLYVPLAIVGVYYQHDSGLLAEIYPGLSMKSLLLLLFSTPILFVMGRHYHIKAYKTMMAWGKVSLGMDFMISVGTLVAYLYSFVALLRGLYNGSGCSREKDTDYFQTAASLIVVMLLGKFLESYAKGFTNSAISALSKHKSMMAKFVMGYEDVLSLCLARRKIVEKDDEEQNTNNTTDIDMSIDNLGRGDLIRLVEGDVIAADGILVSSVRSLPYLSSPNSDSTTNDDISNNGGDDYVRIVEALIVDSRKQTSGHDSTLLQGRGTEVVVGVDESMLSGESVPISKKQGDKLYGGTIVVEGTAYLLVSATGDDSTLGKIIATVQDAQASRPPVQETADLIARFFIYHTKMYQDENLSFFINLYIFIVLQFCYIFHPL